MEGVAAGAQTGKAAVYRLWPSKDLVAGALRAGLPHLDAVPDEGSVREDLLALCRRAARETMFSRPGFALRSVIHECDTTQAERLHGVIFAGVVKPAIEMLREVIERRIKQGEVRSDAANRWVFDAIPAMTMYRSKMCGCEWRDQEI